MNKAELIKGLRDIGLEPGMSVEVHSSLSSFGRVEGGAETVISALMECVGEEGSIFMPALRLSPELELTDEDKRLGITTKIKVLPEDRQRSAMGIIADTFRQREDVFTGDGIFQIAGWGKHGRDAATGGLDYVLHNGGKGLLLGVDIYKLTAMHYVEGLIPEDIGAISAPNDEVKRIYPSEEWFIETGRVPVLGWYTIQNTALEREIIRQQKIGECSAMFFDLWKVVGMYEQALKNDPYSLFGVERK